MPTPYVTTSNRSVILLEGALLLGKWMNSHEDEGGTLYTEWNDWALAQPHEWVQAAMNLQAAAFNKAQEF